MDAGTLLLWCVVAALATGLGAALGVRPWIAARGNGCWATTRSRSPR